MEAVYKNYVYTGSLFFPGQRSFRLYLFDSQCQRVWSGEFLQKICKLSKNQLFKESSFMKQLTCCCCGYKILDEEVWGSFENCPVCYRDDDIVMQDNPFREGGAHGVSLWQAQRNYGELCTSDKGYLLLVREPLTDEKRILYGRA